MSIQSMTGFGRSEVLQGDMTATAEIKSVNNRYRDVRFKLPAFLAQYEIILKQKLSERFSRGSFDVHINFKKSLSEDRFDDLDSRKIVSFIQLMKDISDETQVELRMQPSDFLRSEFYKDKDEDQTELLLAVIDRACVEAMENLKQSREIEGRNLVAIILDHIHSFEKCLKDIETHESSYHAEVTTRLKKRFKEFSPDLRVDEARFLQEVVYYLEKLDIHEEMNRIKTHLKKIRNVIASGGEVGRQIDFLVQELNRETNTIGSKAGIDEISNAVVLMKVQLEKIREQGLNLE